MTNSVPTSFLGGDPSTLSFWADVAGIIGFIAAIIAHWRIRSLKAQLLENVRLPVVLKDLKKRLSHVKSPATEDTVRTLFMDLQAFHILADNAAKDSQAIRG